MSRQFHLGPFCLAILLTGCVQRAIDPPPRTGEPLGLQLVRTETQLKKYPFRTLLEFEADTDPVFVRVEGPAARLDPAQKHTGSASLRLGSVTTSASIRLPSLFSGSAFPGRWALAGAYFYAQQPQHLGATYDVDGAVLASINVQIPARQWTPVLLDVASATEGKNLPIGVLRFTFDAGLSQPVWCDDVLVMDNTQSLIDSPWTIKERGFRFTIARPGSFTLALDTPDASPDGWTLEEANAMRARFSSGGHEKSRAIYFDGRQIIDGKLTLLTTPHPDAPEHHQNPGRITIAPEMGRPDRNSPGDLNNDGYSELSGDYPLIAAAPRIEFTLAPQSRPLFCPVVEIAGLPPGKVLANMEGRPIETIARTSTGRVLILLPGALSRPTLISLRVSQ